MLKYYDDIHLNEQNKIAVVVCTYVGPGSVHYYHDEDCAEKLFEDVKLMFNCHKVLRSKTLSYELIIIDNSSSYTPYLDWIKTKLEEFAPCSFLSRENDGFSFGAYQYVWKKFKDKYNYYLFHEQDIIPCRENWLEEFLLAFHSEIGIGVVGNHLEMHPGKRFLLKRERVMSFDGSYIFTSSKILKECGLKVYPGPGTGPGVLNEINFIQPILEKGYKMLALAEPDRTFSSLSDGSAVNFVGDIKETIMPMITLHAYKRHPVVKKYFQELGLL